ncbi:hypothetical protein P4E94_01350 [Pontiellaceae bacterium B12219]|nr:hypothetical protein [Pontiellaceae bacterium B12219]
MNTKPDLSVHQLRVTQQTFISHNSKPAEGKGFVNFHFNDNRKECLCDPAKTICWKASLVVKAFSGTGEQPDPEKDLLLMEATASVEGQFELSESADFDEIAGLAWYFDEICRQKLLSKMRLLLLDTEFAGLPLPGDS